MYVSATSVLLSEGTVIPGQMLPDYSLPVKPVSDNFHHIPVQADLSCNNFRPLLQAVSGFFSVIQKPVLFWLSPGPTG